MVEPSRQEVQKYYDERVAEKLHDFTHYLPRVEAAVKLIADWAPPNPRRILEIGCGVGATSWRMARAWPRAQVIGTDISPISIEAAKACFERSNLSYATGSANEMELGGEFDLIVMMDVYEHILPSHREELHASICKLLSSDSRFILTIPTPANQDRARQYYPDALQPVDENIDLKAIEVLLAETNTKLLFYREMGVWNYGDYFHLVVGRYEHFAKVASHVTSPGRRAKLAQLVKRFLNKSDLQDEGKTDYLGPDIWRRRRRSPQKLMAVSRSLRQQMASNGLKKLGIHV